MTRNSTLQYGRSFCCSCEKKQRNPHQTDLVTICDFFTAQFENSNKTLCERIFGRGCAMRMIRLTCLIAAKQLSSYSPEKINPLLYFFAEPHSLYSMFQSTTKILSLHDIELKCTSSTQTCSQPNCNTGHQCLQPGQ